MTLLFVSPHLDDAVLSCGGAIHAAARSGARVVVATVFSECAGGARRRAEDLAAVNALGAEAVHLGLTDAPERLGLERTHRALVEEAVVAEADVTRVRDALVRCMPYSRIWIPLGVGDHVDHRVVHAALEDASNAVLYEDRPYAFLPGAVRARIRALGLREPSALAAVPGEREVHDALERLPHLRAYAGGNEYAGARAWLAARARQAMTDSDAAWPKRLRSTTSRYDEDVARAVTRAILAYESQVPDLFGTASAVGPAMRQAAVELAGPTRARARGRRDENRTERIAGMQHAERTFVKELA